MTDLSPFQPSVTLSREQHQVLALAAVFQAAQIVHLIALRGSQAVHDAGDQYSQTLLQAALNIRATDNPNQNSLLFFGSLEHLGLGLRTLEQSLIAPYDPQPKHRFPRFKLPASKQTLAYAMAMLRHMELTSVVMTMTVVIVQMQNVKSLFLVKMKVW